jgi:hypothetical protein
MSGFVSSCYEKSINTTTGQTKTFTIKSSGTVGKIMWLKADVTGGDVTVDVTYYPSYTGSTASYVISTGTADYEFGYPAWQDAAKSTLKEILIDQDDYVTLKLTDAGALGTRTTKISFLLIGAVAVES